MFQAVGILRVWSRSSCAAILGLALHRLMTGGEALHGVIWRSAVSPRASVGHRKEVEAKLTRPGDARCPGLGRIRWAATVPRNEPSKEAF
jgi:hypothetical protein